MHTLKEKEFSNHNLTVHGEELEKEEWTKPKDGRGKEIIKIRVEVNKIENGKAVLEKINNPKVDSVTRLTKSADL